MDQSAELKELTLRFYEALSTGDPTAVEKMTSTRDGVVLIGTDPEEWWAGYANITRALRTQMEEMGGGIPVVPGDAQAFSEENVGWVADQPMFRLEDGTEVPFRFSAVFHREGAEWKLVQGHASVGVPNEEAVGRELTT